MFPVKVAKILGKPEEHLRKTAPESKHQLKRILLLVQVTLQIS